MEKARRSTLIVSRRGQITLPADVRKRLGLKEGGVVTLEEGRGEIILRPAAVIEIDVYSNEDIERWDREDALSRADRRRITEKLARKP